LLRVALQISDPGLLDTISTVLAGETSRISLDPRNPDVIVADHLPAGEAAPLIVLAGSSNALGALRAGASGVLPRNPTFSDLMLAIEAVAHGFAILPRGVAFSVLADNAADRLADSPSHPQREPVLTPREREVLRLLAAGASNKLIARKLGISFHTAKFHVASIAEKLDATGRTDAVAQAVRLGLILL